MDGDHSVRPISAGRAGAARRNCLKSTGPRTEQGKRVVALNAIKGGLRTQRIVLPNESEEEWLAFRQGVIDDLAPVGIVEGEIAERVATLFWRQRRPARYEAAALRIGCEPPDGLNRLAENAARDVAAAENAQEALRGDGAATPLIDDDVVALVVETVADVTGMSMSDGDFQSLVPDEPWSNKQLVAFVEAAADAAGASIPQVLHDAGELAEFRRRQAQATLDAAQDAIAKHRDSHLLLNADVVERVARYEAHVDRCLRRALDDLQKLQARRVAPHNRQVAG
jgi:hypothetical protein